MIELKIGDRVYIPYERGAYRVKVSDDRYAICTKPYNPKRTVKYFIVDKREGIRGTDNMVFCSGYETTEQCEERLKELQEGSIEISQRNRVPWDGTVRGADDRKRRSKFL